MKLALFNFRKYKTYTVEFSDSKCILLKGISGIGKSTILESIRWCLYGKLRDVYNYNIGESKKPQCVVILELQKYKIARSKNPEALELTFENQIYTDDVAQNIINNEFGDYKFWNYSSYCVQNENNILLEGSERDKIDLLNCITFHNSDPSESIDKISKYIKDLKIQIEVSNHKFNYELQRYNEFLKSYEGKIIQNSLLDAQTYTLVSENLRTAENQLQSLYQVQISNNTNLELYNTYKSKYTECELKLQNLKLVDLTALENKISKTSKMTVSFLLEMMYVSVWSTD